MKTTHTKIVPHKPLTRERNPEYMVQISEPKAVRKEVLETVRDVIIFMQGHENFLKIQEEKLKTIAKLKSLLKELNHLIDTQLRAQLPQGKLQPVSGDEKKRIELPATEERPQLKMPARSVAEEPAEDLDLAELESQLKDIENRLNQI